MVKGILGKKIGMTQVFDDEGRVIPVTVVQAGPCVIVQRKKAGTDGYEAAQLGLVEASPAKRPTRPVTGHFAKAGVPPTRFVAEVPVDADDEAKPGDAVLVELFEVDDTVKVTGTSKGRGFQGVIRRHGFGGGRATLGSMFHRAPGSIGAAAYPARVFPGVGMPGQHGNRRASVKNVRVVKVDAERNLLFLKGGVPGARDGYLRIVKVS
ncbi:MAG: 50S ribosomal protein L3 [Acidobacteria bacterium]|nr:50S ribosomal protein L3 [Acidobacteriota bacterium]